MGWYLIESSNHPEAGQRLTTQAAADSWETRYHGEIATTKEARATVDSLSKYYRNVRAFKGRDIGKLFYAVLDMKRQEAVSYGR